MEKNILSFTDIGKSCPSRDFLTSQICILTLFAKIKSRENFRIYSNVKALSFVIQTHPTSFFGKFSL